MEGLEGRRLLSDLAFGDFALSGDPLFARGGTTRVTVVIRDLDGVGAAAGAAVDFKYLDVGFGPNDQRASFDDPAAMALTSFTTDKAIPASPGGQSFNFDVTFPRLGPGRYELLGKVGNRTRAFGSGRVLPSDGNLLVAGGDGADHINISAYLKKGKQRYIVAVDGAAESFSATKITAFTVHGRGGNDSIFISGAVPNVRCDGGDGNDKIVGGDLNDTLSGGAGNDTLVGGDGDDRLNGNGGNDRLFGENGVDRLYGYAGNDYLDGGAGSDRLDGGAGFDTLLGQGGNDRFFTRDGAADELFGGSGQDSADSDALDMRSSIEVHL